jgi:hypothetical protein
VLAVTELTTLADLGMVDKLILIQSLRRDLNPQRAR